VDLRTRVAIRAYGRQARIEQAIRCLAAGAGSENPDSGIHRSTALGDGQMTDAMAMRMFSRGVIVGLFIGLYIGWVNWAA
jgi:hypothetical protein